MRNKAVTAILLGGFVAGTLDIAYAIVWLAMHGRSPLWTLQSVATGWLGKDSFSGGLASGALGLASHYAISFAAAAVFILAARRAPLLHRRWILFGALFGIGMYLAMNFIVVPLSASPFAPPKGPGTILQGFVSHALLFGIPIAYFSRR